MSDIYKYAARKKIRFPSSRGNLTVEQLYDLHLKSTAGADLNTVARTISNELKTSSQENFVDVVESDPKKKDLEVALEIVKDVIAVKQAENKAAVDRAAKRAQRQKLLDALSAKKDAALTTASMDELQKQLDALDDAE